MVILGLVPALVDSMMNGEGGEGVMMLMVMCFVRVFVSQNLLAKDYLVRIIHVDGPCVMRGR